MLPSSGESGNWCGCTFWIISLLTFEILRRHSVIYLLIQNEPLSYLSGLAFAYIYLNLFLLRSVRWTLSPVTPRTSSHQKPSSSAGSWAATPRESPRSQAVKTGPSIPPSRRESTQSTRWPPPTPSASRSGASWTGTSPSQEESWVSGAGTPAVHYFSGYYILLFLFFKVLTMRLISPTGPTMKLKRPVVGKMYKEQIENFYKEVVTPTTPDNPLPSK